MTEFSSLRQAAVLSIPEAARIVGVATSTAYRWEHGEVCATPDALERLRTRVARKIERPDPAFTFIDLFAGIGGLRRGFDAIGGRCVFTSEWNAFAKATYLANYYDGPDHVFAGDITKVDAEDIPEHDVLLAGFPCQPVRSETGTRAQVLEKSLGMVHDLQWSLFSYVARIIDCYRPKLLLFEYSNLLLSEKGKQVFGDIRATLEQELGYTVSHRVVDAQHFVPQNRECVFIAAVRKDLGRSLGLDTLNFPAIMDAPRLASILHPEDGTECSDPDYTEMGRVHQRYTLSDKLWQHLQTYAEKQRVSAKRAKYRVTGPDEVTRPLSAQYYKDGSDILIDQGGERNPRRLTPRECARLMGFDRPGDADFMIPVSDTDAYVQFGNASVVPVVEAFARQIQPILVAALEQHVLRRTCSKAAKQAMRMG